MHLRIAMASVLVALSAGVQGAEPQPAPKDAAQAVGEGNTSRWLDYYRRERGQDWVAPPAGDTKTPARVDTETSAPQPAADSAGESD